MQFVNIIVHSVEDMNYRVHLQYEFTKLGLDDYLEKLKHTESEDLQVPVLSPIKLLHPDCQEAKWNNSGIFKSVTNEVSFQFHAF